MQLHLQLCTALPARESCHHVHGLSLVTGGRCRGMGAITCQIRPGKHRSISRVFPRVSPYPRAISTTGRTKNHFGPRPRATYSPAPIRVAVKVLSHGSSCLELMSPHSHTATSYGGREGMACLPLPPQPACLPAWLPNYLLAACGL